ncbi:Uncharacterised protein [Mycobacteroides abscessus subsp. abscessus]|nr:Uncharacterised protein [Mycobacteroides abscessus subsp. abscessus]
MANTANGSSLVLSIKALTCASASGCGRADVGHIRRRPAATTNASPARSNCSTFAPNAVTTATPAHAA